MRALPHLPLCTGRHARGTQPDDRLGRFEAALAAQDSATAALEGWCGARVTAAPVPGGPPAPTARNRDVLKSRAASWLGCSPCPAELRRQGALRSAQLVRARAGSRPR